MTDAGSPVGKLALRLIMVEATIASGREVAPALSAIEKLRPLLATLMGSGGIRALVGRSLSLAKTEAPWLGAIQVSSSGDLEGLDELRASVDPAQLREGSIVLLAQLLGLLVTFIGAGLTSQLVGEIWPQIPLEDRDLSKEH